MENFYETDIEGIKEQLITFFSQQDEFKDYNFDGSAITELLNLMAYTVQYQNLYLNFNSSEQFLSTAQLGDNVYKIANTLNYIPKRKTAPYIEVNLQRTDAVSIIIPKYSTWTLGNINLTNLDDINITDGNIYSVQLYEGAIETESFVSDGSDVQIYELSEREDIDNDNLFVFVDDPDGSGGYIVSSVEWENINKNNLATGAKGYYIHYYETMEIRFDNGDLFEKPTEDQRIRISYLKTNGDEYNGSTGTITLTDTSVTNYDKVSATPTTVLKNGADEESLDNIKSRAPQFYTTQNRAVTERDYNILLTTYSQYDSFHSGIVWGGEKESINQNGDLIEIGPLKDLGHVYISALKSDYDYLDATEQSNLEDFFERFKIITLFFNYLQPTILNVKPTVNIKYVSNIDLDLNSIETQINEYLTDNDGFEKSFYLSDLIRFVAAIDDVVYTTVSYTTTATVYNEDHKIIRLGQEVVAGSISATVNGNIFEDDGAGQILWNSVNVGYITYSTGVITLDQDFGVTTFEFPFTYVDTSNFTLEREMFLKNNNVTLGIL